MAANNAHVSQEGLEKLQKDLLSMAEALNELYRTLENATRGIGEEWQDDQYDEFVASFRSPMNQLEDLAEKYKDWATSYIQMRIDAVQETKNIHVGH